MKVAVGSAKRVSLNILLNAIDARRDGGVGVIHLEKVWQVGFAISD